MTWAARAGLRGGPPEVCVPDEGSLAAVCAADALVREGPATVGFADARPEPAWLLFEVLTAASAASASCKTARASSSKSSSRPKSSSSSGSWRGRGGPEVPERGMALCIVWAAALVRPFAGCAPAGPGPLGRALGAAAATAAPLPCLRGPGEGRRRAAWISSASGCLQADNEAGLERVQLPDMQKCL